MSILKGLVRKSNVKANFIEGTVLGVLLTTLSYVVALTFGWVDSVNSLEAFAVFTSYLCTYLCVRERRINYLVGVVTTAAYCALFLQSGLLASALLNAYLVPTLAYGWFRWRKDSITRPVQHVKAKTIPIYVAVTAAFYAGAVMLTNAFGGSFAAPDAAILIGTILAQFLLDNKKIETWYVWAVVNVFAIYTYAAAGLALAAFQFVFFLANTVYGYFMWNRSMRNDKSLRSDDGVAAHQGPLALATVQ